MMYTECCVRECAAPVRKGLRAQNNSLHRKTNSALQSATSRYRMDDKHTSRGHTDVRSPLTVVSVVAGAPSVSSQSAKRTPALRTSLDSSTIRTAKHSSYRDVSRHKGKTEIVAGFLRRVYNSDFLRLGSKCRPADRGKFHLNVRLQAMSSTYRCHNLEQHSNQM